MLGSREEEPATESGRGEAVESESIGSDEEATACTRLATGSLRVCVEEDGEFDMHSSSSKCGNQWLQHSFSVPKSLYPLL
mmetsp:Transcript_36253/g.77310  ORF Transcript_36253/g.77310 Transcript_36253/m.77310 type:complete len:80 (+) Transcript_36253:1213-1452(+)